MSKMGKFLGMFGPHKHNKCCVFSFTVCIYMCIGGVGGQDGDVIRHFTMYHLCGSCDVEHVLENQ